ncbi:MAG: hypothetical protein MUE33_03520 [Cytophagaceae bacterium]|nr:hypothetical protein [Cytophagaceae bacterium]
MGCSSCSSGCSTESKGCGSGGCSSGGCNKLNSFDWLGNMTLEALPAYDVVEIRFKNGRKEFFRNTKQLELYAGDPVVIEVASGHHIGYVSLQGEMVRLQMRKKNVADNDELKAIYRKATAKDIEKFDQARNREHGTLYRTREIIQQLKLNMKLSDIEYQADNTKATFYYSADDRVDFRELIKLLASEFKIRVEMKQISLRHEAARLGGIGSCGRELCCSTWLTDFKNVNTSAARYQNLSLNPSKLSGQCGRLKCCLNYELDTYLEALKGIPEVEAPLKTSKGDAFLQKTDIFRRIMWFGYRDESTWHPIPVDRVAEILELNKSGETPISLETNAVVDSAEEVASQQREQEELSRFDDKFKKKKKKKKKKPNASTSLSGDSSTPPVTKGDRPERQNNAPRPENRGPRPERSSPAPFENKGPRPERQNQQPNNRNQENRSNEGNNGNNRPNPYKNRRGPRPNNNSSSSPNPGPDHA